MEYKNTTPDILTGKPGQENRFISLKPLDTHHCTKQQIKAYFENTYDLDENLYLCIKQESTFFTCPNRLRLPIIFYYGHTASVFINKLFLGGFINERVNFEFEKIFETGVDEMLWDDTENYRMGEKFCWPPISEIKEYRRKVRELVLETIDSTPLNLPIVCDSPWWALLLCFDHTRIHIELSSVMLHELPVEFISRPVACSYAPLFSDKHPGDNTLIPISEGKITLGKPFSYPAFGWDNEYGQTEVNVPAFSASKYLVSNEEFLAFVESRGYETEHLWSEEGWQWVQYMKPKHPHFWVCDQSCKSICGDTLSGYPQCKPNNCQMNGSQWVSLENGDNNKKIKTERNYHYRTIFEHIEMTWTWPAIVNYHEAKAFCSWKGESFRLPTEAEHHRIRGKELPVSLGLLSDPVHSEEFRCNTNLQYWSCSPVNHFPPSDAGFYDSYGNVWDWTECHFNGLDGFKTYEVYDDFSSPCFDGRHNVIMGGSWVSSGTSSSRYGRYAFRRHFFQHAGFRLVKALDMTNTPARLIATQPYVPFQGLIKNPQTVFGISKKNRHVSSNTQFQYELDIWMNNEIIRQQSEDEIILKELQKISLKENIQTFLHIGCGLGYISFALSDKFNVTGIDYCARYIDMCQKIVSANSLGDNTLLVGYSIPSNANTNNTVFKQFTWLSNEILPHDMLLVSLLDRVMNFKAWLLKLFETIKIGHYTIIVSSGPINQQVETILFKNFEKIKDDVSLPSSSKFLTFWRRLK